MWVMIWNQEKQRVGWLPDAEPSFEVGEGDWGGFSALGFGGSKKKVIGVESYTFYSKDLIKLIPTPRILIRNKTSKRKRQYILLLAPSRKKNPNLGATEMHERQKFLI